MSQTASLPLAYQPLIDLIDAHVGAEDFENFLWDVTARVYEDASGEKLPALAYVKLLLLGYNERITTDETLEFWAADSKAVQQWLRLPYGVEARCSATLIATTRRAIGRRAHHALVAWLNRSATEPGRPADRDLARLVIPLADLDGYLDALDGTVRGSTPQVRRRSLSLPPDLVEHVFAHVGNIINATLVVAAGAWLQKKVTVSRLALPFGLCLVGIGGILLALTAIETSGRLRYMRMQPALRVVSVLLFVCLYVALTVALIVYQK